MIGEGRCQPLRGTGRTRRDGGAQNVAFEGTSRLLSRDDVLPVKASANRERVFDEVKRSLEMAVARASVAISHGAASAVGCCMRATP